MGSNGIDLLADERMLLEANDGILTLTSHRVRFDASGGGDSRLVSITLDSVASCGIVTTSHPWLLILAVACGVLGLLALISGSGRMGLTLWIVGGLAYAAYQVTKTAVLEIGSAKESITVRADMMTRSSLTDFINTLERAKFEIAATRSGVAVGVP